VKTGQNGITNPEAKSDQILAETLCETTIPLQSEPVAIL
jgi:hypothetical protein